MQTQYVICLSVPPQAVQFLPTLQGDLGSLVPSAVEAGPAEAVWTTSGCAFHKVRRRGVLGDSRWGQRGKWCGREWVAAG